MEELRFVAPIRFVPTIVTGVPPAIGPVDGVILVRVGGNATTGAITNTIARMIISVRIYSIRIPVSCVSVEIFVPAGVPRVTLKNRSSILTTRTR